MKELKSIVENFDVISFDVFDTLLLRPYLKPTDLFRRVGGALFAKERINAEHMARLEMRVAGREEVTFDQIYAKLPKWQHLKERELEEERRCLTANPEVVEVFNFAKLTGKKCVIASDMYLPRQFLETVLRENGIDGWSAFYLSCDCGVQKASGKMFEKIAADMCVAPHRILHIGDDVFADVRAPERIGVGTWWYPKMREVFLDENPYAAEFLQRHSDPDYADFVGALILAWHLERCHVGYCPRQKLACLIGSSVVFAFVKWMIDDARARGINRFLFVARDGYTPKRLVELLAPEFKTDYIYAPRSVAKPLRDGAKVRPDYVEYIRSLDIDPRTTAIVDGNTEFYSSQRLVDACLTEPCMGYYFIRTNDYGRSASYFNFVRGADFNIYMMLESMYCAPTLPIQDVVNGRPVYFKFDTPYEQIRADSYSDISDAILRASALFNRVELRVNHLVLLGWLDAFQQRMPLADARYLCHLKNASDVAHTHYHSVTFNLRVQCGWKRVWLVPVKVIRRELDGAGVLEYVRILGLIPARLRYRIIHEVNERMYFGDALVAVQHWVRDRFPPVLILRKIYRLVRHHGEYARPKGD